MKEGTREGNLKKEVIFKVYSSLHTAVIILGLHFAFQHFNKSLFKDINQLLRQRQSLCKG